MNGNIAAYLKSDLTSLGKELRIDALESFLPDDSRRTLSLEAAIYPLQFGLCESGRATKACQRVWPVSRRLLLLVFRVCKVKAERIRAVNREKEIGAFLLCIANPPDRRKALTRLKNFAGKLKTKSYVSPRTSTSNYRRDTHKMHKKVCCQTI